MAYERPEPLNGHSRGDDADDPMIAALRRFLAETDESLRAAERVRLARAELARLLGPEPTPEGGA